jgi:hypothetical protein
VAAIFALAKPCSAQVRVELTPFVGSYRPIENLVPTNGLADFYTTNVRQQAGLSFGGRVTAWLTDRLAIEGSYAYLEGGTARTVDEPCVDFLCGPVTSNTPGHLWMVNGQLLFIVAGRASSPVFYVSGGPSYIGNGDSELHYLPTVGATIVRSPGAVGGIGARFTLPGTTFTFRAGVEDCVYVARLSGYDGRSSWAGSQLQNDLLLSTGLSVPLLGRLVAR